nr:heparan-alpha-glucosaminide N-acetyltransferase domain-containing protein [Rhodococcus wratislaviensis]GLK39509.1 hypothetical protein GCM10017611_63800 [Rhodococcus wratislaviensis]
MTHPPHTRHQLHAPADLTPAPTPPATPDRPTPGTRLIGIDAARGVALLGMMAVHSLYASDEMGNPTLSFTVAAGRAAALFAVLAGVGIALTTGRARVRRADAAGTAAALAARAIVIGSIGLALGYTDAELGVVILPFYAVMFVLAIPLVLLPTRAVSLIGVIAAVGVPVIIEALGQHLPESIQESPSLIDLIDNPGGWLVELLLTGEFPALPWMAYLCAGLVIGRLRLSSVRVAAVLLLSGTVLAVATSVLSQVLLYRIGGFEQIVAGRGVTSEQLDEILVFGADGRLGDSATWWWLAVDAPHTSTPLDLLGTIGSSVGVLGAMLLLGHIVSPTARRALSWVLLPLAAAGSMTLTLYTLHICFINSPYDRYSAVGGYTLQVLAALVIGLVIRATAGRGPLEAFVTMVAHRARSAVRPRPPLPPA